MNPMISYQEFPVNVLPPILANTIYEVANQTKAPLAMIATAVLGAMSLTCQNRINICRMGELIAPCSLYILSIADSGERKTAIDNILMKPIYELEKTLLNEYKSELTAFNARTFEWEQKKKIITSKLKKAIQSNNEYDYLTKEMEDLFINQPEQPKRKQINFNDATPASIKTYLGEHSKSIGIMSDEGGTIINAKIVDDLSFLNKLWDGSNYSTERKTTPSNHINNARLTISIMVQYGVLKTYLTRRGENARSSGFLARFLVCYPPSTQGTRYITNPVISTEHVHEFHKRIKSIMYESQSLDSSDSQMLLLNLDPEAQQCWINYYNEIESQLLPNGYLYYFKEYASKVADNAARIAALIHYFIGNDGCISLETMNCAIVLSRWYLNEYIRVFSIPNEEQTAQLEADELFFWINNLCMTNGLVFLKKNHLLQYGPNKFREKKKLDFIINILYQQNRIQIRKDKKTNYIGIVQPRYTQNIPPELIYKH